MIMEGAHRVVTGVSEKVLTGEDHLVISHQDLLPWGNERNENQKNVNQKDWVQVIM